MNLPRNLYLLVRDEQDSIRICGNTACIALGSVLSEQDCIQLILPLFLELACDQSWRVRYTTVTQIHDICKLFPPTIIQEKLVPEFLRLMQDPELEVRTGAASSLSKICSFLEPDFIVEQMMRIVGNLGMDTSEHVRIGLSNELLSWLFTRSFICRFMSYFGKYVYGAVCAPRVQDASAGCEYQSALESHLQLQYHPIGSPE